MNILHLTLKKKWFDMIAEGIKTEEYREIKPYWEKRLEVGRWYDVIKFRNGYSKNSPEITVECRDIFVGYGRFSWGAPEDKEVYILKLGKILK